MKFGTGCLCLSDETCQKKHISENQFLKVHNMQNIDIYGGVTTQKVSFAYGTIA